MATIASSGSDIPKLRPLFLQRVGICGAAIAIASGALGLVMWLRGGRLVPAENIPSASSMLCLAVLAGGVLATITGRTRLAAIIAGFVLAVSTDTLISSVAPAPLRVDQRFVDALLAAGLPESGRLTPQIALCAIGMSVAILGFLRRARAYLPATIASLVTACGAMSMLGYGVDLEPLYGWAGVGRMAFDNALSITVLSLGLLAGIAADTVRREPDLLPDWFPLPIGVFTATGGLILWHATTAELVVRQVRPIIAGSASTLLVAAVASALMATVARLWVLAQHRKTQLERTHQALAQSAEELQKSAAEIRALSGLIPICAWCKSIRSDSGYWNKIEKYLSALGDVAFTHSICPACSDSVAGDVPHGGGTQSRAGSAQGR